LMPDQFWSLTFREFQLKWAAFERAEQRAEWLVGRHAYLTVKYAKDPGSPERLLGYRRGMNRYPIKQWLRPE
jgi:hypothetical protein